MSQPTEVRVLVAADEITPGVSFDDALQRGDVVLAHVPDSEVSAGATDDPATFLGTIAVEVIEEGEQITSENVVERDKANHSVTLPIPKGKIAISILVSPPQSGGLLPGAKVRIVGPVMGPDSRFTREVLQRSALILAAGTYNPDGTDSKEARMLITVAVTEPEAEEIRFAEKVGKLTVKLLG